MALTKCLECSNDVSDKAVACPKCGAPLAATPSPPTQPVAAGKPAGSTLGRIFKGAFYLVLVILVAGLAISVFGSRQSVLAIRPPKVLFSDRIELKEGAAEGYGFTLEAARTVQVSVSAMPKPVNVMLMSEDQWRAYAEVKDRLFGGKYYYERALSKENVMKWSARNMLAPGAYRIVVERPREALIFEHPTVADVTITAL